MADADQRRPDTTTGEASPVPSPLARLEDWILLEGDRSLLAAGIVAVGFLLFVWLAYGGVVDLARNVTPMLYLFSALVGGNITLITIVVTITQLVLARELRSPRELRLELESAEEYRESVEEGTGHEGVPERPADFLRVLVGDTRRQVAALDSTFDDLPDSTLEDELRALLSNLRAELDETLHQLESSRDGLFSALTTVLDADFSARLNHSRWIRRSYPDRLSAPQRTALEDLERHVKQLDVARQYFKTIYIKQELGKVSLLVMYAGLAATGFALASLVVTGYARTSLSPPVRFVFVPLAVAVNLAPLAILASHVMRITTVTRRTAAITPFISPGE